MGSPSYAPSAVTEAKGRDLLEQRANLGGVALVVGRELGREDLAGAGIDREVELAPGPLAALAMLLDQPLARAVDLHAGRVDHHVNGSARLCLRRGERQPGAAPRK